MGGLEVIKEKNEEKAKILYDFLDESKLFKGTVRKEDRSLMNVPFVTGNEELDAKFVKEAKEAGLVNLKGHRSVGGMRASIYNAMPVEGVEKLLLNGILSRNRMDIVEKQDVDGAESVAHVPHLAFVDAGDDLVSEILGAHIEHLLIGLMRLYVVEDGKGKVGLADTRVSVEDEGVIFDNGEILRHRH